MEWSSEFPKEPGYYWFLDTWALADIKPQVVSVEVNWRKMLAVWFIGDEEEATASKFTDEPGRYRWLGPIKVPDQPAN